MMGRTATDIKDNPSPDLHGEYYVTKKESSMEKQRNQLTQHVYCPTQ